VDSRVVKVANRFAAHWAGVYEGGSGAQAAVGVWPLLALLADGAKEPGRGELAAALGVDADEAVAAAHEVLAVLESSAGVSTALGLWTKAGLPISRAWLDRLPVGTAMELDVDVAASQERLDTWARSHTDGLVERMPVEISNTDLLVLASALFLRTAWAQPFGEDRMSVDDGPWQGRTLDTLRRTSAELDQIGVARTAAGELTAARIVGDNEIDVVLVLGEPDATAAEVLEHGVRLVAGEYQALPGSRFTDHCPGPGLTRKTVESATPGDRLALRLPIFAVSNTLSLLQFPEVFGLVSVTDGKRGHFPGISSKPLAVSRAAQDTAVSFTAKGFTAAAVTAFAMEAGGRLPELSHSVQQMEFVLDRPFGFIAAHRASGLILLAGWVDDPGQTAAV
jgi:serine protease inhibitor